MLPPLSPSARAALLLSLCACIGHPAAAQDYTWRTHAGSSGGAGLNDGYGEAAHFSLPSGVAVDGEGNFLIADTKNHSIRKIAPDGRVSTWAGRSGSPGSANGEAAEARFNSPAGIAVGTDGTIYVSETVGHTIRKITPGGTVSLLAGSPGEAGSADGAASAARFNTPRGLAVDPAGNVYVADSASHTIRKVQPDGTTSTVAGLAGVIGAVNGAAEVARFRTPRGVAVAADGTIYVADGANQVIRRIAPDGTVTTLAGLAGQFGTTDGSGSEARFHVPAGICLDGEGNLRVADLGSGLLRKVTPAGVVTTIGAGQTGFQHPPGVAVTADGESIVAESGGHTVWRVSAAGVRMRVAGSAGAFGSTDGKGRAARFQSPNGLAAAADGSLAVADTGNYIIRRVAVDGSVSTAAGVALDNGKTDGAGSAARFSSPAGVTFESNGNILVADTGNRLIRSITPAGVVSTVAGQAGSLPPATMILGVSAMARDTDGSLVFAEAYNLRRLPAGGGAPTFLAGPTRLYSDAGNGVYIFVWNLNGSQEGSGDGSGSDAFIGIARGLCIDTQRTIYFSDTGFHTIRKCTAGGSVTTITGTPHTGGYQDGAVATAMFRNPIGLTRDAAGNLYVADSGNHAIRRISPKGEVTTIGGLGGYAGSGDGTGSGAQFNTPMGIALDGNGFLYVTDSVNSRIVRGVPPDHPEIEVANAAGSLLFSGTASFAFGEVLAGQEAVRDLTIRNPGTATLEITGASLQGEGFAVDPALFPLSIQPEEERVLAVKFTPQSAGARSTALFLHNNDANEPSFRVNLSGTGLNRLPVFAGYSFTTPSGQPASVSVVKLLAKASDADGDTLSLSSVATLPASQGSLALQGMELNYTPPAGFSGEDRFQVTISDANGGSVNGTIIVTVAAPGDAGMAAANPPRVEVRPDGKIAVQFHGIPWRTYTIERSADMNAWQPLSPATAGPNGLIEFIDEAPLSPQGFYRLITP